MIAQLLNIAGILLVLATLPLLAELLVLTAASLLPSRGATEHDLESADFPIAVVIPAHNEEALIERCIRSIAASARAGDALMVVAHNCTDATAAKAEAAGARVLELNDPDRKGKGCALSFGFEVALAGAAKAVLVIDADSVASPGLIDAVRQRFLSGAQALQCRYEVHNSEENDRTRLMALAFQGFNVIRPRGRERLGLSAGILGNGFALHRNALARTPYGAYSIVEDLEYHLALVRAGIRVEFVERATVNGEMPRAESGARTQRARWEGEQAAHDEALGPAPDSRDAARANAADGTAARSVVRANRQAGVSVADCRLSASCMAQAVCAGSVSCARSAYNGGRGQRPRRARNDKNPGCSSWLSPMEVVDSS